jgi:hypothetical protein
MLRDWKTARRFKEADVPLVRSQHDNSARPQCIQLPDSLEFDASDKIDIRLIQAETAGRVRLE